MRQQLETHELATFHQKLCLLGIATPQDVLQQLTSGLSQQNFRLVCSSKKDVFIKRYDTQEEIQQLEEKLININSLAFTIPISLINLQHKITVQEWVTHHPPNMPHNEQSIDELADALAQIHTAPIQFPNLDIGLLVEDAAVSLHKYQPEIKHWFEHLITDAVNHYQCSASNPCPCHLDLSNANLLRTVTEQQPALKLIDWEYAAQARPELDLAFTAVTELLTIEKVTMLVSRYQSRQQTICFKTLQASLVIAAFVDAITQFCHFQQCDSVALTNAHPKHLTQRLHNALKSPG